MPIFVGVRWWGGVKWECGRLKCEFSLSIAVIFRRLWSAPLASHIEIYTASRGCPATARLLCSIIGLLYGAECRCCYRRRIQTALVLVKWAWSTFSCLSNVLYSLNSNCCQPILNVVSSHISRMTARMTGWVMSGSWLLWWLIVSASVSSACCSS